MKNYDGEGTPDAPGPYGPANVFKVAPRSARATGRVIAMRRRWSRTIAGSAVVLTMLAGCTSGQSETAGGAEGPSGELGSNEQLSDGAAASEQPRETADPCEGRNDELLTQIRCDVVAWADLDLDGTLEPIAVATGGEPSINLLTVIDGETVEYSATYDPDTHDPYEVGVLGPEVGSMEARRHAAFVGAYDMTGDGRPELVMWADKGPNVDEFRVIRVGTGGLESLNTPLLGMHGGGKAWVHYLDPRHPSYRCTDDPDAPLEYLAVSADEFTATRYEFDETTDEFVSLDDRRPVGEWTGEVPTVGVDCTDHAQHEPAPDPDGPPPGESERCPLGQLPGRAQSGDVGAFIEGSRTAGNIGCERIAQLWEDYERAPKDQMTNGKSMIVDFGSHSCSMAFTQDDARAGRYGGCGAKDDSWAFIVVGR